MPTNRKTLIKIALKNPDLIDVIEPMLRKAARPPISTDDLVAKMADLSDLLKTIKKEVDKHRASKTNLDEDDINWIITPIKLELENFERNLQHAIKELK